MTINAHTRTVNFTDYVRDVLGDSVTEDQLQHIEKAHAADVSAAEAYAQGIEEDCKAAMRNSRMHVAMLTQLRETVSAETYRSAEMWARMQCAEQILAMIRNLVDVSVAHANATPGDGPEVHTVPVAEIVYAMSQALQPITRKSIKLAYVTDARYAAGQFEHLDATGRMCRLPFIGWALISEVPQEESIQAVFLVNGAHMTRDEVRAQYGWDLKTLMQ